jgi:hypothetical protein
MRGAVLSALLAAALCAGDALAQKAAKRPAWAELTAEQQMVLAPLKADWESLAPERRRKWIGIAKRYPKMKPEAQERVQRRMQAWASLSPEQRDQARERYKRMSKAPRNKPGDLRQQWAEYLALPPHERERLWSPEPQSRPRAKSAKPPAK